MSLAKKIKTKKIHQKPNTQTQPKAPQETNNQQLIMTAIIKEITEIPPLTGETEYISRAAGHCSLQSSTAYYQRSLKVT